MKPQKSLSYPDQKDNKVSPEQFLITMSNKQNAVIKYINHKQEIKSQKIISLHIINDLQLLNLYYAQLDRIKDYLIRRYELKSQLDIDNYIEIKEKQDINHRIIKINTKYWEYPTLQAFLQRQSINPSEEIERDRVTLMHFFEEFFEIILRAGGIDYFFYTPKNLFIIRPRKESYGHAFDKIILNFTSMTGIKLFVEASKIYREDLGEIYALIPPNFYELRQQEKYIELNTIIKKRALAFLILCFVIRKVPNLITINNMDIMVTEFQIRSQLKKSASILKKVIGLFQSKIKQAEKETGIQLQSFFTQIFVTPYPNPAQASLPTWDKIYVHLFQQNETCRIRKKQLQSSVQLPHAHAYYQKMLVSLWGQETNKIYYLDREYAIKLKRLTHTQANIHLDNPSLQQKPSFKHSGQQQQACQSMIYFLTKFNCSFHKILRYPDPCVLLLKEHFSQDVNQVILKLVKIFNSRADAMFSQVQNKNEKKEKVEMHEKPQKGDSMIGNRYHVKQESFQKVNEQKDELYNPFLLKTKQQISEVKKQLDKDGLSLPSQSNENPDKNKKGEFFGKIQDASSFLSCAYSLHHLDKQVSNKEIISLTNKQAILTDVFASLWKF